MGLKQRRAGSAWRGMRDFALRSLLSGAGASVAVGLASLGMLLTTASRVVSLLFEPLSLLYLPGIVVAIAWTTAANHLQRHPASLANSHEFSPRYIVLCSLAFYFAVVFWLLGRRQKRSLTAAGTSA